MPEIQEGMSANIEIMVSGLSIDYRSENGSLHAVSDASFDIRKGQVTAIVGESGCGKTTLGLSLIGLLPSAANVTSGKIMFEGQDILSLSPAEVQRLRGTGIGMIFQEPLTALDPVLKIREQLGEAITIRKSRISKGNQSRPYVHKVGETKIESPFNRLVGGRRHLDRRFPDEVEREMLRALKLVRIPDPERILRRYPFELSGGMSQRAMIAIVLSESPRLLIADEPTTALDVTTQAQILRLMKELVDQVNTSLLLVTHDLGVAAQIAQRVLVMYAGQIVEDANVLQIFSNPRHPYTKALLICLPKGSKEDGKLGSIPGSIPDLRQDIRWCPYVDRCQYAMKRCREEHPPLEGENDRVACFLYSK